mgnify:CR=1 FL=1
MKKLVEFILEKITGSTDFSVNETVDGSFLTIDVTANPEIMGMIIGKEGKTIKNIRKILSIKGVLEQKSVRINVTEATN